MNNLPFNRWTLLFNNEEYERLYEQEANKQRLLYYRIFCVFVLVLATIFFILFAAQGQGANVLCSIAGIFVTTLLSMFTAKNYLNCFGYIYTSTYLASIGISLYIMTAIAVESQYVYGYCSSTISFILFLFCNHKLQLFIVFTVPILQWQIINITYQQQIQFTILMFTTKIFAGIYAHHNEFMARSAFSYNLLNEKTLNIIQQFVPDSLFAITLNPRTNQFELQFQNLKSQKQLNIDDTKSMIEMLRNTIVTPKGQTIIQTQQELSNRREVIKKITLEEYAFHKIKADSQDRDINELDGLYVDQKDHITKRLNIEVKQLQYITNILVISLKQEKQNSFDQRETEQLKFLKKIIKFIGYDLYKSQTKIFSAIQRIPPQNQSNLTSLKSLSLFVMNEFQNFIVFINQNQIHKELSNIKSLQLKPFLKNLEQFFNKAAQQQQKLLNFEIEIPHLEIKINTKYLTQILVNVFQQSLNLSNLNSCITINVSLETNLNPLSTQQNQIRTQKQTAFFKPNNIDSSCSQTKFENQMLLKFSFSFETACQIQSETDKRFFLNPTTYEEFYENNNQDITLQQSITDFLLEKIGPYNKYTMTQLLQTSCFQNEIYFQTNRASQSSNVYLNLITFFIYTDQGLLNQSYLKSIHSKNFLQN